MPPDSWSSYTVLRKENWVDAWTEEEHLICLDLTVAVMPTIDTAKLFWRSGNILQAGENSFVEYPEWINLIGQYVRIQIPSEGVDWVGYCLKKDTSRNADKDGGGGDRDIYSQNQQFIVVGLEWFLARRQVDTSVFYTAGGETDRVGRAVGFNMGMGGGRSLSVADRGNMDLRVVGAVSRVFAEEPEQAIEWNATQIVSYLLDWHGPEDDAGSYAPTQFLLDTITAPNYLDWYLPIVPTEGRTVFELLDTIIDRRRGLVWWLEFDPAVDTDITVQVSSSLAAPIVLPGGATIPAAAAAVNFNFDQDLSVQSAVITRDGSQRYDRVKIRGARRQSVMSVSIADGNLETSWENAAETAYKAAVGADAEKNDRYRQANQFERVYQAYRIPATWDGQAGDGEGGVQNYVNPVLANGSTSILGGEPFNLHGLRMLSTMPLKAGFDYVDATNPQSNLPPKTRPENLQPFALVNAGGGKFVFLNRTADHIDEDDEDATRLEYSYGMRAMAAEPGFELRVGRGLPHALAQFDFDPDSDGPSRTIPELNYGQVIFTVCCEWDSYCEGAWPVAVPTASPVQELVIYAGERHRLDWLAENTIYDIDPAGVPRTVGIGGPLQDDRRRLEDLARLAYQYYSVQRVSLNISWRNLQHPVAIGTFITSIGTVGAISEEDVNATVTQISMQPEAGTSSLQAGYAELDFGGLV